MKTIRSFIFIAIGMMALTVTGATHSNLEQKQKTELVNELTAQTYDVCVNFYQVAFVFTDVVKTNEVNVMEFKNVTIYLNYLSNVSYVVWQSSKPANKLPYKENLSVKSDFIHPLIRNCRSNC